MNRACFTSPTSPNKLGELVCPIFSSISHQDMTLPNANNVAAKGGLASLRAPLSIEYQAVVDLFRLWSIDAFPLLLMLISCLKGPRLRKAIALLPGHDPAQMQMMAWQKTLNSLELCEPCVFSLRFLLALTGLVRIEKDSWKRYASYPLNMSPWPPITSQLSQHFSISRFFRKIP